jgi:hypothetical protein
MQAQTTQRTQRTKATPTSGACPSFFRAHIAQAPAARRGYFDAGYHLAIHVREHIEDPAAAELDKLIRRTGAEGLDDFTTAEAWDDRKVAAALDALWTWLGGALPRCMALVPSERKRTFMAGVLRAITQRRM